METSTVDSQEIPEETTEISSVTTPKAPKPSVGDRRVKPKKKKLKEPSLPEEPSLEEFRKDIKKDITKTSAAKGGSSGKASGKASAKASSKPNSKPGTGNKPDNKPSSTGKIESKTQLLNLTVKDCFADAADEDHEDDESTTLAGKRTITPRSVHIRGQQRNGRKSLTLIEGLPTDLNMHKILRYMKKMYSTNGTVLKPKDKETGENLGQEDWVLQLQGDLREDARNFLIKYKICEDTEVVVHGF